MKTTYSVIIIDDDVQIAHQLQEILAKTTDFRLTHSFVDIPSCIHFLKNESFVIDIILLDIGLPMILGNDAIPELKFYCPTADIVMLTVYEDTDSIVKSLENGAISYLLKKESLDSIVKELRVITEGGAVLSPNVAKKLITLFYKNQDNNQTLKSLTAIEDAIIHHLSNGFTYNQIAEKMNLKIDLVRYYIKTAYKKLHVNSKGSAVKKYLSFKNKK